MKRIHIIEASVALGLVVSILTSVIGFGMECKDIRNNIVRLHILANSDSQNDQEVKLVVRDVLLDCGKELFSGNADINSVKRIFEEEKDELTEIANKTLSEKGFEYSAEIYLVNEYFSTRSYDGFTLPAGNYPALKVVLGEGKGHNWWCVMFPPLCLPAAGAKEEIDDVFGESGTDIIKNYPKYEMKFKVIEIYECIKNKFKGINIS